MADDNGIITALAPGVFRAGRWQAPRSLHVSSAHAPRPVRRIVTRDTPPRTVTYDGVEFEVVFDGVDDRVVEVTS